MTSNNNNNERKNTMTHIDSIFGTMYGGFEVEIDKCVNPNTYRIIIKHDNRTLVHYSSTANGCYTFFDDLKETW